MGYEPEFQEILWENKKDALTDGTVDCLWGCFSMNGREDEYQWAGPYLYSSQVVVVREDSEIQTVSDLTGKRIAVQETSKAEEYLLQLNNEKVPDVEMVYAFSNMDEVYAALRKGYVDAICGHESALNVLVAVSYTHLLPDEHISQETEILAEAKKWLDVFFSGEEPKFTPPLHPAGSEFRQAVWKILLQIPYGHTITYGEIARKMAERKHASHMSAQAVGGAVGHNEISIIVPCHRVVGSNGCLLYTSL